MEEKKYEMLEERERKKKNIKMKNGITGHVRSRIKSSSAATESKIDNESGGPYAVLPERSKLELSVDK